MSNPSRWRPSRRDVWRRSVFLAAILLVAAPLRSSRVLAYAAPPPSGAREDAAPRRAAGEDFRAIERQVESVRAGLVHSTVALYTTGGTGSGVILTPDGLVLTAAHVIAGREGQRLAVVLEDGRRFPATRVGADGESDLGLVRMTGASDLPAATLGDSATVRRGQWVLVTGHPLGRHAGRPPVVRIGRVFSAPGNIPRGGPDGRVIRRITTDAPLINGDSGGPLFDLDGHVVGINSMIAGGDRRGRWATSVHSPVNFAKAAIERARAGDAPDAWDGPAAPFAATLRAGQEALTSGDAITAVRSARQAAAIDPASADAALLMARALARDGRPDPAAAALSDSIRRGFNDAEALRTDRDLAPLVARDAALAKLRARLETFNGVPGDFKGDERFLAAAAAVPPSGTRVGVVRVRSGGRDVALGTVVSADGDILTKASELPRGAALECVLPDGRAVSAARRGADPAWDVALLKVKASGLRPVLLAEGAGATDADEVGRWTFSPDGAREPAAVGVVGVTEMPVRGRGLGARPTSKAFMGVRLAPVEPDALRALGLAQGVGVEVDPELPAARAGIRSGDVLFEVDGHAVGDPDGVMDLLVGKQPGDSVAVRLARGDERLRVTVSLTARPADLPGRGGIPEMLSGDLSRMSGPFPRVLDHDAVLRPNEMGGPVLNSDGRCIGLNIARADRTSTYAIRPADLRALYAQLKSTPAP